MVPYYLVNIVQHCSIGIELQELLNVFRIFEADESNFYLTGDVDYNYKSTSKQNWFLYK